MQMIDYKPLGTIVKVAGNDKRFMITGRAVSVVLKKGDKPKMFDYAAVLYPEGIGNRHLYFQDSDISEVVFRGFADEEEERIMERLKDYLSGTDLERASMDEYNRSTKQ